MQQSEIIYVRAENSDDREVEKIRVHTIDYRQIKLDIYSSN